MKPLDAAIDLFTDEYNLRICKSMAGANGHHAIIGMTGWRSGEDGGDPKQLLPLREFHRSGGVI